MPPVVCQIHRLQQPMEPATVATPCGDASCGRFWVQGPPAQLGLPGLSVVTSSAAHWLRRLVWVLVLVAALTALIVQLVGTTERLRGRSVVVSSRETMQLRVPFPAVTMCAGHPFKEGAVLSLTRSGTTLSQWRALPPALRFELLRWQEISLDEFFQRATYAWSELVSNCTFNRLPCEDVSTVRSVVSSQYGRCHTLTLHVPTNGTWSTPQLKLDLALSEPSEVRDNVGWYVMLHPHNLPFSDITPFTGQVSQVTVPVNTESRVRLQQRTNRYISNNRDGACSRHMTAKKFASCLADCLQGNSSLHGVCDEGQGSGCVSPCSLPWQKQRRPDRGPCRSFADMQAALSFERNLRALHEEEVYNAFFHCECASPCEATFYPVETPDRLVWRPPDEEEEGRVLGDRSGRPKHRRPELGAAPKKHGRMARVLLWISTGVLLQTESWSFSFPQFVAEAGGNLGIMLGASLLSLVEIADLVVFWVARQVSPSADRHKVAPLMAKRRLRVGTF
ncbi:uncharacterized protein LOC119094946 [Pollicipes pollicipes]|uniref:uncharacterized protein LOC119094946 n=1 Tax=Pollicipes pollicipes TaxID=41117 RepID=UPI001884A650|nr:uncharacterized protein LOC119094946 [Pollicipes pollicipes]